jgi:stage V sporulation protein D (sporulation-specific penicillin-binding protein)
MRQDRPRPLPGQRQPPPGKQVKRRRSYSRSGITLVSIGLVVFAIFLSWQLYQIQIVDYHVNAEKAAGQHYKRIAEEPRRGSIYDRNGVELAGTTYVHRIGITPKDVRSIKYSMTAAEIADRIAECLGLVATDILAAMQQTGATYIQLKKDAPRDEAERLRAYLREFEIGGVRIDTEPRRYYTNGSLASQVIGFCLTESGRLVGQLGVELYYNDRLTGQPGYTYVETDNYGSKGVLPFSIPTNLRARDGENLILSLDVNIQKIAQDELARAISIYDITDGGVVLVMNPYTGAVLAMASYPYFASEDPTACPPGQTDWNSLDQASIDYLTAQVWRNRAISDAYEPGSTFKAITAAIGLEEALVQEKTEVVCEPLRLYNWTITCVRKGGHGKETLEQGFWRSCNPVFAQLALRIGVERFYTYIDAFGFRNLTGIDLPAEGRGLLHANPTELDMATLSFGESSTVTPLQMAVSTCVFANGGYLVQPSIVKAITDSSGALLEEQKPETVRQVISENTAARVRELMKGVVLYGTGSAAYVEGYSVAGKTSTSTDEQGDHILSFTAIAPSDNPEIVVLVVLNRPLDRELTSRAAAETCGSIIARTLEYLGVSRAYSDADFSRLTRTIPAPDVTGLTYAGAQKMLAGLGLAGVAGDRAMGDATLVKYQWPAAGTDLHPSGSVVLYPVTEPEADQMVIPDFTGRTVNECFRTAAESGLNIRINGACFGVVVSQSPQPTAGQTDPGTDNANPTDPGQTPGPAALARGSVVIIEFAAVEEELAQSG